MRCSMLVGFPVLAAVLLLAPQAALGFPRLNPLQWGTPRRHFLEEIPPGGIQVADRHFVTTEPTIKLTGDATPKHRDGHWIGGFGEVIFADPFDPETLIGNITVGHNSAVWMTKNSKKQPLPLLIQRVLPPGPHITERILTRDAEISAPPGPEGVYQVWTRLLGNGVIVNPYSPVTIVQNMSLGQNEFRWHVHYPADVDVVVVTKYTIMRIDCREACHSEAACTEDSRGAFHCFCNTGYAGNGLQCVDIDECAAAVYPCHSNAACVNTPGSYSCSCDLPFVGDGLWTCDANLPDRVQHPFCDAPNHLIQPLHQKILAALPPAVGPFLSISPIAATAHLPLMALIILVNVLYYLLVPSAPSAPSGPPAPILKRSAPGSHPSETPGDESQSSTDPPAAIPTESSPPAPDSEPAAAPNPDPVPPGSVGGAINLPAATTSEGSATSAEVVAELEAPEQAAPEDAPNRSADLPNATPPDGSAAPQPDVVDETAHIQLGPDDVAQATATPPKGHASQPEGSGGNEAGQE